MREANKPKWRFIYALLDPQTNPPTPKYVGCTSRPDTRLYMHVYAAAQSYIDDQAMSSKDTWLCQLVLDDLYPEFEILEMVKPGEDWESRERHWIEAHRATVLNVADGGVHHSSEDRARLAGHAKRQWQDSEHRAHAEKRWADPEYRAALSDRMKVRMADPATRAKLSEAKLGHVVTEATREKLRQANLGKTYGEETRRKKSLAMQGFKHSDDARRRISETRKAQIAAGLITMPHQAAVEASRKKVAGSVWINDGKTNKRIAGDAPVPDGWRHGRALSEKQVVMYAARKSV